MFDEKAFDVEAFDPEAWQFVGFMVPVRTPRIRTFVVPAEG